MAGKRIMKFLGIDCGPNRIPLQNITEEEEIKLRSELDEINFFSFCNK
jgi:N-acetylneuraminate lyase